VITFLFLIRGKHKEQRTNTKRITKGDTRRTKRIMSSAPRSFMESDWDEYDFSDENYESDNRYYAKYGGNACMGCMGGSYIRKTYIKKKSSSYDEDDF